MTRQGLEELLRLVERSIDRVADAFRGLVARVPVERAPGALRPTLSVDARLEVLASCPREVKNRTRVRVYLGAAELLARLTLLDAESLRPGASGLIQLRLEQPAACAKGDRFVLRREQSSQPLEKTEQAVLDLAGAGFTLRAMLDVIPDEDHLILRAVLMLLDLGLLAKKK